MGKCDIFVLGKREKSLKEVFVKYCSICFGIEIKS